jgi:hypothetical protein
MKTLIIAGIAALLLLASIVKASAESSKRIELSINLDPLASIDKNQSYLIINSLPSYTANTKQNISIPLSFYRGSTLKRTVYVWIQDTDNNRISNKAKFSLTDRFRQYNLSANLEISRCSRTGTHVIVAEGLDINSTKQVSLEFTNCIAPAQDGKLSFSVIKSENTVESGKPFKTRLLISNPTDQHLEIISWSYVYRSSKCYSGEREQNRKTINVPEFSNITFDLENTVNAPAGDFNLKIKFLRSDQKTPKEITLPITVTNNNQNSSQDDTEDNKTDNKKDNKDNNLLSTIKNTNPYSNNKTNQSVAAKRSLFSFLNLKNNQSEEIVYESSSAKARKLIVYILILVLTLVLVALIMKKL